MDRKSFAEELNDSAPYAHPDEIKFLQEFGRQFLGSNYDQIVMIGAGPAVMAVALLENHPDPPEMTIIDHGTMVYAKAHLQAIGLDLNNINFWQTDSEKAGTYWQWDKLSSPIDFLIIDGDHTYSGVYGDICSWLPHMRVGGYVLFHDYLERPGGFNGGGEWRLGSVAQVVKDHVVPRTVEDQTKARWKEIRRVGISILVQREV